MNRCENLLVWMMLVLGLIGLCCVFASCSMPFRQVKTPALAEVPTPDPVRQLWQAAKKSNWLVTLSILGIAAGVFALANGAVKLGTASIASASVSLFMTLAVARFSLWMAVFGLIGSMAAALFSVVARRKALIEIVTGVQRYKEGNNVVGEGSSSVELNALLGGQQTSTTKKIVQDIKAGLKLNGTIR